MAQGFDQIVSALEVRFDFQSARIMAREALAGAGLEEKGSYSKSELGRFADGLNAISDNLTKIWAKLGVAPTGVTVPEAEPEPAVEADAEAAAQDEDSAKG